MIDEIMEELLLFLTYTYMDAHNITVKGLLIPYSSQPLSTCSDSIIFLDDEVPLLFPMRNLKFL